MQSKTYLTANRKYFIPVLLIIIILVFHFLNGWINLVGVPVGLLALLLTGFNIFKNTALSPVRSTKMIPNIHSDSKENIPEKEKKSDMLNDPHIDLSVIGTEYRQKEFRKFESCIDIILDKCIELIHAYIKTQSTAIFFPTEDGGYKIRKFISNSTYVNKDAVIYPGVGVIGSFLKKGLKQLKLTDIVTDSMTLYYYTKDVGIRSLLASPIVANAVTRGIIIVDSVNKNHFTDSDCEYLSNMADLCGQAVYNSYLYNQHKLNYIRLLAMSSTEKFFFQEQNIDSVLDKLIEIIPYAVSCDRLSISLLDDANQKASVKRVWGIHSENLVNLDFSISEKSIANFVYTRSLCFMRNFSVSHYEIRYCREETQIYDFRSFIAFPLGVENCKGMILLESLTENVYS
ncbi:MAG: GAF domain-containing protein, partial [Chitinispirillia bacterium]